LLDKLKYHFGFSMEPVMGQLVEGDPAAVYPALIRDWFGLLRCAIEGVRSSRSASDRPGTIQ
jgi:hypothetical protein